MRRFPLHYLFLAALALPACDRTNAEPPDSGGRPRDGGTDAELLDAPTDASAADAATDAASTDVGELPDTPGLDAPPDAPVCDDPRGCWACEPTNDDQFLNRCTDATCEPFVNDATRLPLLNADGTLPPLP